eukprot:m.73893 g.73893  ORF g.73893 m.73893 type:complete len:418 (+) comp12437_c0_seq2:113-1366(+)
MFFLSSIVSILTAFQQNSLDNLARTPPMGWRSWNYYACEIDQQVFEKQLDAISKRSRLVDGEATSLADLGYNSIGIDDCWQNCLSPNSYNHSFHDNNGNPLVDMERFPSLTSLAAKASSLNVMLGWYGNNCPETTGIGRGPAYCGEKGLLPENWDVAIRGDIKALKEYGFQGIKLDGCGPNNDMLGYYHELNATGHMAIIENCHYNTSFPYFSTSGELICPMHLYRISNDIKSNWDSVMSNVHQTIPYNNATPPLSQPHCWAYPDMLEVGVVGENGHSEGGLTLIEQRTHFGLWCIVSSPLTLSFDLTNDTIMDSVWDFISNKEALAVNQIYYNHPGTLLTLTPTWELWSKPIMATIKAYLLVNTGNTTSDITITFDKTPMSIRDIWNHTVVDPKGSSTFTATNLASHDSRFLQVSF